MTTTITLAQALDILYSSRGITPDGGTLTQVVLANMFEVLCQEITTFMTIYSDDPFAIKIFTSYNNEAISWDSVTKHMVLIDQNNQSFGFTPNVIS